MTAADTLPETGQPAAGRWTPGEHILWRYRGNGSDALHICRPVTVVHDGPDRHGRDLLAVWMAPGTECVRPVIDDGTPLHKEPLETRYTKPRRAARSRWFGAGVLKLARPGEPWSVWLFWERGWRFKNWYVNLEEPLTRWSGGVDSEDHFLDIAVYPDRSWQWRDEDEFDQAQRTGLMDEATARQALRAGEQAVAAIRAWGSPFTDSWQHWRPDPSWSTPRLPLDWDQPAK
ncbi:DUF402 domain-containing protein [Streptomyces boninensis]|uniref:cytidylyl-2-hydroxypropylphosphonate hydrolase n=1 Tax=Streptomyces boninensis TaxID=2039455 RepID=UPI003B21FE8C